MSRAFLSAAVLISLSLAAVACNQAQKNAASGTQSAVAGEYYEHSHKGRLYVLGSKASLEKLQQGQDLVFKVVVTGAGPQGETVVFEADKEGSATEDRLRAEFAARHPAK